jgi:hypothetical protein
MTSVFAINRKIQFFPFFTFERTDNVNEWNWDGNTEECRKRDLVQLYALVIRPPKLGGVRAAAGASSQGLVPAQGAQADHPNHRFRERVPDGFSDIPHGEPMR